MESDAANQDRPLAADARLVTIFAVTLMAVLGVASVAPAFPAVARALEVDAARIGLLITAFTLPGVVLSPVLGVWADRWGRRAVLIPALSLFAVAGVACTFAPSLEVLVGLRLLQGIGAAPLGSLNLTLIGDLYHGRRQIAAMGANGAVLSVGTALYPLVGGGLAAIDWRLPFALPILAVPVTIAAFRILPDPPRTPVPLGTYLRSVLRKLDRHRLGLMAACLLVFVVLYGSYLTYVPFLADERFDATPAGIGMVFFGGSVATALVSARLSSLTARLGRRRLLVLGALVHVAAMVAIPFMTGLRALLVPAIAYGIGSGMIIPTLVSWLAASVEHDVRAGIMALNALALRGGQTLGPVVAALGYAYGGLEGVFATGAVVSAALFVLALTLRGE